MPDVLKSIQPPFSYCQADIFGPILAYNQEESIKPWVLVVLCLSSRAVHLEILHNYSAQSISRTFRRTYAIRGSPRIIWIDAGIYTTRYGKYIVQSELRVLSALVLKLSDIEFRVTLSKHHEGIGAVEPVIEIINNTVSKSLTGLNLIKMDNKELHTWLDLIIQKMNNRPLILGAPQGITITHNHILLGFRNTHGD